jgi:hypothetical protein
MRRLLLALLALTSAPALGTDQWDQDSVLYEFTANPDVKFLPRLRAACEKKKLTYGAIVNQAPSLKENGSVAAIRALLTLRRYCSDGELAQDLSAMLGIELLTTEPKAFLKAVWREELPDNLLQDIVASSAKSDDTHFAECGIKCAGELQALYDKKLKSIRAAQIEPDAAPVQRRVLGALNKAKKNWQRQLTRK